MISFKVKNMRLWTVDDLFQKKEQVSSKQQVVCIWLIHFILLYIYKLFLMQASNKIHQKPELKFTELTPTELFLVSFTVRTEAEMLPSVLERDAKCFWPSSGIDEVLTVSTDPHSSRKKKKNLSVGVLLHLKWRGKPICIKMKSLMQNFAEESQKYKFPEV